MGIKIKDHENFREAIFDLSILDLDIVKPVA